MSLFSRLFGRKPKPAPLKQAPLRDRRHMNEDWRVGDLAVCLYGNWAHALSDDPARGEINRVSFVCDGVDHSGRIRTYGLGFVDKSQSHAWATTCFRKVRPDTTEAEEEFTALIKRPVRQRERA